MHSGAESVLMSRRMSGLEYNELQQMGLESSICQENREGAANWPGSVVAVSPGGANLKFGTHICFYAFS